MTAIHPKTVARIHALPTMMPASVSHTNAEGSDPRLPNDVCQLQITFAHYTEPLLWVCIKRDRKTISAVIGRWANAQSIKERLALLIPCPDPTYQLLYTVPPMNIPKFPRQLSREMSYDVKGDIHFTFAYFPPARCSFCGEFGTKLLQFICVWCQVSPTYHHTECCTHVNMEIREKLRRKHREIDPDLEEYEEITNRPPDHPPSSGIWERTTT